MGGAPDTGMMVSPAVSGGSPSTQTLLSQDVTAKSPSQKAKTRAAELSVA